MASVQNQDAQTLKSLCRIAIPKLSNPDLIRKDNPNFKIVQLKLDSGKQVRIFERASGTRTLKNPYFWRAILKSVNFSKSMLIRLQSALHCTQYNVA